MTIILLMLVIVGVFLAIHIYRSNKTEKARYNESVRAFEARMSVSDSFGANLHAKVEPKSETKVKTKKVSTTKSRNPTSSDDTMTTVFVPVSYPSGGYDGKPTPAPSKFEGSGGTFDGGGSSGDWDRTSTPSSSSDSYSSSDSGSSSSSDSGSSSSSSDSGSSSSSSDSGSSSSSSD